MPLWCGMVWCGGANISFQLFYMGVRKRNKRKGKCYEFIKIYFQVKNC